jgi:3-oxoacyl-[acyl-carrier protein] reductase
LTLGAPSVLVNCAGGPVEPGQVPDTTKAHWETTFAANLYSTVLCSQEAMQRMSKGGKIINVTSVLGQGFGGREGVIAYSAAKAAVSNFTKTLAKQLVPDILVNEVSPGRTLTDYYDRMSTEEKDLLGAANKIDRWIEPTEIAKAVMFILDNDAMVGETVSVDGGFFM